MRINFAEMNPTLKKRKRKKNYKEDGSVFNDIFKGIPDLYKFILSQFLEKNQLKCGSTVNSGEYFKC